MLRLHDTLTRAVRTVEPLTPGQLRLYSCGPTVYRSVHIGNLRTYLLADWIKRAARGAGLQVRHVKNITDVGHMRQELAERGGDKVITAALAAGRTPREIADAYEADFHADEAALGIEPADVFPRATGHIPEMIALIERLQRRSLAYAAGGNVYFDTAAHPGYGRLSGNVTAALQAGAAVEVDPHKRHPADFTLWKGAEPGRRFMVWESPFGLGFPGWHIECSAMSMAHLGESFDLHTGGVDNIFPHHEDELAQSEGATGVPFAQLWVHGQHLLADGLKMAKATGNVYTLATLTERGYDPLAFRYLCAGVHYRTRLNFTLTALTAAQRGLQGLRQAVARGTADGGAADPALVSRVQHAVQDAVEQDLALPRALATCWDLVRHGPVDAASRAGALLAVDRLLGLGLDQPPARAAADGAWRPVATTRERARAAAVYAQADDQRHALLRAGVVPEDGAGGDTWYRVATAVDRHRGLISSPQEVPDERDRADRAAISVSLVCQDHLADVQRCLESLRRHRGPEPVEILAVDNGTGGALGAYLDAVALADPTVRVFHADHPLGEAAARNVTLRAARGTVILVADTGLEATGDCFTPLRGALRDPGIGAVGRWGVRTDNLREFRQVEDLEVDAIEGYCLAFARARLREVGLFDEGFRFYRLLDFDWSLRLRAAGLRNRRVPDLPVTMHVHRGWAEADPEERDRLSRLNFRRFYAHWHHRQDLVVAAGARPEPPPGG